MTATNETTANALARARAELATLPDALRAWAEDALRDEACETPEDELLMLRWILDHGVEDVEAEDAN